MKKTAKCADCGLDYEDPGWIEAVIPDKAWNDISPTGSSSGLLCITCISRRLAKKGYQKVPVWLCGIEPIVAVSGDLEGHNMFVLREWKPKKKHIPTADELTGIDPDFTGDMSTDEYIDQIRGRDKD